MNEINKRFDNPLDIKLTPTKDIELWPRFKSVKNAIFKALGSQTPQVQKEITTFSWSGADDGIHDYEESIEGTVDNIHLNIVLKGTIIINDQSRYTRPVRPRIDYLEINGLFISKDKRKGAVNIILGKGFQEAYWLQTTGNNLKLEQVVLNGKIIDVQLLKNEFTNEKDKVNIPGTRTLLPLFISGNRPLNL